MEKQTHILKLKCCISIFFLFVLPSLAFSQTKEVTGVVTLAEDGLGAIGVSVVEKGTTNGTVTDIEGKYRIQLTKESATLVFSMVGMIAQEKTVSHGDVVDVVLSENQQLLNEIVVTGYTSQRKADLTGAVSVVSIDEIKKVAENNPMKALQGKVAGMMVTTDGNPSGASTIRIRGIGTLNNNDPLYIIDGVPTKAGMHELNSADIESIQVLKDASSASIYGSRAANGVIIITTKQGKKGKVKIDFNAGVTTSKYTTKMDMLNTQEYGRMMWQAEVNAGKDPNANAIGYTYDWGYDANGVAVLNKVILPEYVVGSGNIMRTANTDWFDQITRTGVMQNYDMSVSSGTDNGSYFFSLGYLTNEGVIKNSDFDRISARMNTSYKLFDGIVTIGENFTLNRTSEIQAPDGILNTALQALPMLPVYTESGGWGGPVGVMNDRQNPVRLVEAVKDNRYSYWRTFGNAFLAVNPIEGLDLRTNFGLDYGNYYKRDLVRKYQSGKLESDVNSVNLNQGHWLKWNWNAIASYNITVGKHRADAMLGVEAFREENVNFNSYREGFELETPEYMWPDVGTGKSIAGGNSTAYTLLSFFGKVNYSFDDRYLASVTLRRDGSSRFGKNNKYGTFPAFSLGWRLSEEAFIKNNINNISDLKLRLGWGQTGNQEISNTAIYNIYVPDYGTADPTWGTVHSTSYDIGGTGSGQLQSGFKRTQLANDNLKWETTTQTNIGLDFGFWEQKLYGSAEYYMKKTKDILVLPPYLAAIGEGGNRWVNGASMQNWGMEYSVGYRNKLPFGLEYDITGNLSLYRNEMTYLPEDVENNYGGVAGNNILGHPINSLFGYVADGLFKTQEEVDNAAQQPGKGLGRIRYKDLNGDGVIDNDDRTWIGVQHPDFMYGLNVNFSYKGFDLTMFWQGIHNIDVVNDQKYHTDFWSVSETGSNKGRRLLNAWSPTNVNSNIPSVTSLNTNDEGRFSTYFIENGSYLKLRMLQVGYTFPTHITRKFYANHLRLYISGQNLWTIKSKSFTGVDPESPQFGYPIPRTFTVGLNVSF
ncbi:TonB-dependent receptor [Dysgonomonas sp. 25]|nr:TonB-dependent receptor [Dysgonomonas sp. 25]NDV68802.1 TonB-dependent receptor [Dysgonomonas sp. 25]